MKITNNERKFYERFMLFHENDRIKRLFRCYFPDGIVITARDNEWIEEDKENFPNQHPVHTYALVYGYNGNGFCMRLYWKGDFFHHLSHIPFGIKEGVPVYEVKERGSSWTVLDAFPALTHQILDAKVETALRGLEFKARENIAESEMKLAESEVKLEQEKKNLENILLLIKK